jgi:hypothetical protein
MTRTSGFSVLAAAFAIACSSEPADSGAGDETPSVGQPDLTTTPKLALDLGNLLYYWNEPISTAGTITLTNSGSAPLKITQFDFVGVVDNSAFDEVLLAQPEPSLPLTIVATPGSNSFDVQLEVTPRSATKKEWAMKVRSNDPAEPEKFVGIVAEVFAAPPCQLTIAPRPVDFGEVPQMAQRTQVVTLTNASPSALCVIRNVRLDPGAPSEFTLVDAPVRAVLELEGSVSVTVQLVAGTSPGLLETNIVFDTANSPGVPSTIAVKATVMDP